MAQSDESALLVRMEASLAKFEKQMAGGYAAADKAARMIEGRLGTMGTKVAKSAESSANAMVKELDALRSKYDPLYAASKKYEAELDQVNRAWKVGAINAQQHGAAVDRLNAQYMSLSSAADAVGDSALRQGNTTRMFAQQLSQVGQQTMATGNFMQALAIQLPDMGLAFGAVGAAVGLLAGVALPMLWSAMGSGQATMDQINASLDALETSLAQVNELARIHSADGLQELIDKYGEVDAALLQMIARQTEFAANNAMESARAAVTALTEEYGVSSGALNLFSITGQGAASDVADSLGLTKDAFVALQLAMRDMREAKTFEEQADALGRMNGILAQSTIATGELAGAALRAEDTVRQLSNSVPEASWMNAAIEGLNGLIGRLTTAVGLKNKLAGKITATATATTKGQGVIATPGTIDLGQDPGGVGNVNLGAGKSGGGKGGGGGKSVDPQSIFDSSEASIQRMQREIELLGRNSQEVAKLKAEWAMLDAAKKQGIDLDKVQAGSSQTLREQIDAQAESVAKLTIELEAQKISRDRFEKGIADISSAMANALVGGQSLRDGLADVFRGIAMDLAKSGIQKGLMSLFGGIGGGGGFLGGLFGGGAAAPSFDGGGWTGNGARSGGMDGKGGFPAILHPREQVIDTTKGASAAPRDVRVHVTAAFDESGNLYVKRVAQQAAVASVKAGTASAMADHQKRRS